MDDLESLYQQVILDHSKNPRCFVEEHDCPSSGGHECFNPLCGDQIKVYPVVEAGYVKSLRFFGRGCTISVASASLMCEALVGKPFSHAKSLSTWYLRALTEQVSEDFIPEGAEKLRVLFGVRKFPMRVKCATCGWHALQEGLNNVEKHESNDK